MKPIPPWQFTFFRIIFGIYLAVHFIHLAPWAGELFGTSGILPNPALNPAHGIFPNPLDLDLSDTTLTVLMLLLAIVSLMFAAGTSRKPAALFLWFGWTALFHRNNLISNPSIPYVGLLLILTLLIPGGEPLSTGKRNEAWQMPAWVFRSAWVLMAVGYSFSGFTKLSSPSWTDGSAIHHLLENPLARPGWVRDLMLGLPEGFSYVLTWGTLAAELLFAPLALWSRSRPWIWLCLVVLHLGIIAVVDFADLSLGMLMLHLFTFDPVWLKPRGPLLIRYDGQCLMCSNVIRFLAREDRADFIRFQPLSTEDPLDTMLVEIDNRILDRSDAAIAILHSLGGHWRIIAYCGALVPRPIRNGIYRFIASHRYQWFGKSETCSLPDEEVIRRLSANPKPSKAPFPG